MDDVRFAQVKTQIQNGGLVGIENESFTESQAAELKKTLEDRSKKSLELIKQIVVEKKSTDK